MVLLANSAGTYLGQPGQDDLFAALDARSAVVFIHPADLPGPAVDGVAPFAADFLLDTTRAAYLLVRNGICRRYPNIKFILSHAGGFVPYASHRMAVAIMCDVGRSLTDSLDDFAPVAAGKLFTAGLETYPGLDPEARAAVERTNALALFPRLGAAPPSDAGSALDRVRHAASRALMRGVARLVNTR